MSARIIRTVLSSLFLLLLLASAHLLMVVLNAAELAIERPIVASGQAARLFSDRPLADELVLQLARAKTEAARTLLAQALAEVRAGHALPLRTLPVTPFLVEVALGLTALGLLLLWATSRVKHDAAQTLVGLFAGNLIWTGAVEYGLLLAARSLGVAKAVHVVDGQLVATFGEYVLLKHSWGALVLVMGYLLFLESSRCPVFLWWRERVPTMRGPLASGRIDNYGPRSAFQYATTIWGFYLLLLWAYDERVFGVHGTFTSLVLAGSLAGAVYCVAKLYAVDSWGRALRYAVGAMVVAWTPLEVLGKWGVFQEPWLLLTPATATFFFGGLAWGTWAVWRAQRRARAPRLATSG